MASSNITLDVDSPVEHADRPAAFVRSLVAPRLVVIRAPAIIGLAAAVGITIVAAVLTVVSLFPPGIISGAAGFVVLLAAVAIAPAALEWVLTALTDR